MERIAMDLIGKFKKSEGHEYVLTMIDTFSRFTIVVPIPDKLPATIANAIFKHLICVFGVPDSILTDQGTEFVNQGLRSMCRQFDIRKITCSPNSNSKGNGHIERWHRFVNSSMYALQITHGPKWSNYVHCVAFAYNMVANETTGFSPYALMFGRHPRLPDDACYGFSAKTENAIQANYHIECGKQMKEMYEYVRHRQMKASERNRANRELDNELAHYEVNEAVLLFQPGQPAYTIQDGVASIVAGSPRKWTPQWTGPHQIVAKRGPNNYDLMHGKSGTIFSCQNVNAMFPWHPWSQNVSSTSEVIDLTTPWTFGGLPSTGSFAAFAVTSTTFEVGKITNSPTNMEDPIHFQWWSNASQNYNLPIRPMWFTKNKLLPVKRGQKQPNQAAEIPYYALEARSPGDKPWTDVETETLTNSRDLMLNGFKLTKAGKIPKAVQWAVKHSRKMYYSKENQDDIGLPDEDDDGDMHRVDHLAEEKT